MNSKQKEIKGVLSDFLEGMKNLSTEEQIIYRPYQDFINGINNPGALDEKTKMMMHIAIATYSRNQQSLVFHIKEAYKLGATQEEIKEAAMVAIVDGGIDAISFFVTYVQDAIEALEEM